MGTPRTLRFVTADVFTSRPFAGNQLAVVFGAEGLPTETLQAITREFNYAESTFVFAAEDASHTRRVRIFTPELEVPFAGHPTIGTAHVLVATGEVKPDMADGETTVILGENVGPVPVRVRTEGGVPVHAQLTTAQPPEERDEGVTAGMIADALSLAPEDIGSGRLSPMGVSCGLPFLMVPLTSADAVRRTRLRMDAWERHLDGKWASWPMVFAAQDASAAALPEGLAGCTLRARVFVPGSTVPEDPATGSANACLAAYLANRTDASAIPADGVLRWEVAQGVEMGRPSRLCIEAERRGSTIEAVRVGGATVIVSEGKMSVR